MAERFSALPRRILNLPVPEIAAGAPVNAVLFDPAAVTRMDTKFSKSRSLNTPFRNRELTGRVEMVVLGDRVLLDRL